MSTGLKMSFLACVFYRPDHNAKGNSMGLNFEGLEMQTCFAPNLIKIWPQSHRLYQNSSCKI